MKVEERASSTFTLQVPTEADIPAIVAMLNVYSEQLHGVREFTAKAIQNKWKEPGFDPARDARLVVEGGEVVGYIEVWTNRNLPVHPWISGRVHPDWQGRGIGTALMDWAEARARQVLPRVPDEARVAAHAEISSVDQAALHFLQERGLTPIRHFWEMGIELDSTPPTPEWATGITVRPYDPARGELPAVAEAVRDAFRDHWGFVDEPLEQAIERMRHRIANPEFDPTLWFLAMDGEEIAGIALCRWRVSEDPQMGSVDTLGVRRPWRRRGLGRALLLHAFAEFHQRGQKRVSLGVDASSLTGATRLYEQAGMSVHREFIFYEKEIRPGIEMATRSAEA